MKIVFMGTPDFAVPCLRKLAQTHEVAAVFCQPDRPKGRGKKMQPCPVKLAALGLQLPVHQPKQIRAKKWLALLAQLAPDLVVVAAFGQILSQKLLDIPSSGCLNVHASLLPRWRGASPIHYALREGDAQTGVCIMKMELALDAGPVYAQRALQITPALGRTELEQILAEMGSDLLCETLTKLEQLQPLPQDEALVTYAPVIDKHFGFVDPCTQTSEEISRCIRAFEGWPGVFCRFRDVKLRLASAQLASPAAGTPGCLVAITKKSIQLACAQNTRLLLSELQVPGKKIMPAHAFINGYRPESGELLKKITTAPGQPLVVTNP